MISIAAVKHLETEEELVIVFLCYSSCLADVLIKSFPMAKRKAIEFLDKILEESKNKQEEYKEDDKTLKNCARRGKWKYAVDLFMEFEITLLGNHRAICQTSTKVSKLELHQSKAKMEKCLQWQWNRKIGLSH